MYYFFNLRRQNNQSVNQDYTFVSSHLIVVVRNIADKVPRFWYFGENLLLIPVQRELNIRCKQEDNSNQWHPNKKITTRDAPKWKVLAEAEYDEKLP